MRDDTSKEKLRELVGSVVYRLGSYTHRELPDVFRRIGLPESPDEGSKREKIEASFALLADTDLPKVAQRILEGQIQVDAVTRNAIQDELWSTEASLEIPKKNRREIARALDISGFDYSADHFIKMLDELWVLGDDLISSFLGYGQSLREQVRRHIFNNPGDWTTEFLFDQLGAFEATDTRFAKFLEGLVSSDSLPDESEQRAIVEIINPHLLTIGAELRELSTRGGYPVFTVVSIRTARNRRPKNLIFASLSKPDLRFRSAVDNDIEIASNPDDSLVFDRIIGDDGLRWNDLQDWWKELNNINDDTEAKKTLYGRLIKSLPVSSPPQRNLFNLYHEIYGSHIPDLPALLPEVWLYWDPKTIQERGRDAMLHFRMDFLLLLPHKQRIVIEVDGAQHYSKDGRADTMRYAKNMRGDRELKLSGYEVFRFGGTELLDKDTARGMVTDFFADLYKQFKVS